MQKIGITGGIGSGKTTVCKIFEMLGVPVYYADEVSRSLFENDDTIRKKILTVFGNAVLTDQKTIDRKKVAAIVFDDKEKLAQLNSIIHPAVGAHFENWLADNKSATYVLKEAAILFESGAYKQVDKVITVTAPESLRIERVVKRDNTSEAEVKRRMQAQLSEEERLKRSQFIIVNDAVELVIPQVLEVHKQLI